MFFDTKVVAVSFLFANFLKRMQILLLPTWGKISVFYHLVFHVLLEKHT